MIACSFHFPFFFGFWQPTCTQTEACYAMASCGPLYQSEQLLWPSFNEKPLGDLSALSWGILGLLMWNLVKYSERSCDQSIGDPRWLVLWILSLPPQPNYHPDKLSYIKISGCFKMEDCPQRESERDLENQEARMPSLAMNYVLCILSSHLSSSYSL